MLSHDALISARRVYGLVAAAAGLERAGHHDEARATLLMADELVAAEIPVICGVISAEEKAAKDPELAKWSPRPRLIAGAFMGVAAEHPHAANPHVATPEQPASPVA